MFVGGFFLTHCLAGKLYNFRLDIPVTGRCILAEMNKFTIGQAAKITGLPTKTIRFYEEEGVISPTKRGDNGYRFYPETAIEELKVLKYARDLGLPLSEIKKLMRGCEDGNCEHSKKYIENSIDSYLTLLNSKIGQMETLKARLTGLSRKFKTGGPGCDKNTFCCDILHQLTDESTKEGGGKNARTI